MTNQSITRKICVLTLLKHKILRCAIKLFNKSIEIKTFYRLFIFNSKLSIFNKKLVYYFVFCIYMGVSAVAQPGDLSGSDRVQAEIGMSFMFDACGDTQTGYVFRNIFIKWLLQCPIDQYKKNSYIQDKEKAILKAQEKINYITECKKSKNCYDLSKFKSLCKNFFDDPINLNLISKVKSYNDNKLSIEEFIGEDCVNYKK